MTAPMQIFPCLQLTGNSEFPKRNVRLAVMFGAARCPSVNYPLMAKASVRLSVGGLPKPTHVLVISVSAGMTNSSDAPLAYQAYKPEAQDVAVDWVPEKNFREGRCRLLCRSLFDHGLNRHGAVWTLRLVLQPRRSITNAQSQRTCWNQVAASALTKRPHSPSLWGKLSH